MLFPESGLFTMVLEVFDEESGHPVEVGPQIPPDLFGDWNPCDAAKTLFRVRAQRNPEPGIEVEIRWSNAGLPDPRRPEGSQVNLHLVRPGGGWFDPQSDCYADQPDHDWGVQGLEEDDPIFRQGMQTAYQLTEIIEPERAPPGRPFMVGLEYARRFDVDGYDFGAASVEVTVSFRGQLVWSSSEALGPLVMRGEGDFLPQLEIEWPDFRIRPLVP